MNRPLLLLDVMPGHGRDNIQHELETRRTPTSATPIRSAWSDCALGALERLGSAVGEPA